MPTNRVTFLLATALAVATVGLAPTAAQAEEAPAAGTRAAAADGHLYAWEHAWKDGRQARWSGNSSNWADQNMRNQASSVDNQGYAGAMRTSCSTGTSTTEEPRTAWATAAT
ncbi:hypothetical protein RKD49_007912 [Streptomyces glaucescens]